MSHAGRTRGLARGSAPEGVPRDEGAGACTGATLLPVRSVTRTERACPPFAGGALGRPALRAEPGGTPCKWRGTRSGVVARRAEYRQHGRALGRREGGREAARAGAARKRGARGYD